MRNMSINSRLWIILIAFALPFTVMCYQLISKINENIDFTVQQVKGVDYEKNILNLLNEVADYQVAVLRKKAGDADAEKDIKEGEETVDKLFANTAEIDRRLGDDLGFSDAVLAKHGVSGIRLSEHLKKWQDIINSANYDAAAYSSLLDGLSNTVKYIGDTSGMILDPDLDTYYMVDAAMVMPQMLHTLAEIKSKVFEELSSNSNTLSAAGHDRLSIENYVVKNFLLSRTRDAINTSISEDANFYGISPTLKSNLDSAMAKYNDGAAQLDSAMQTLLSGGKMDPVKFVETADIMHDGTAELGDVVLDELKKLFEIRIDSLKQQRLIEVFGFSVPVIFALIMFFLISNSISRPIIRMTESMEQLAAGNLSVDIPAVENKDEIGHMAKAVLVFKNNMMDNARLKAEQEKSKEELEKEKRRMMHKMASDFEQETKGIVNMVAAAATELSQTAEGMATTVSHSASVSSDATTAANSTNSNIQLVATATDELSSSVREISEQIQKTNMLVQQSTDKTEHADNLAMALSASSDRVEEVMAMISNIASQINLLALNATIESARAGEAGKGFAVVASEVKNLASQTGKSIGETQTVIEEMRAASIAIIEALKDIKISVHDISEATTTVASAVEQQSATTNEIASNMQTAAQGAQKVSNNLCEVTSSSNQAGTASEQMLVASVELSKQAEKLNHQVDLFISKIRAA